MFRSIRFRLSLWYAGAVIAMFLVVAFLVEQNLSRTLSSNLDGQLTAEVEWMMERLSNPPLHSQKLEQVRADLFSQLVYFPVKQFVEVYDADGKLFYRTNNLEQDTLRKLVTTQISSDLLLTSLNYRGSKMRVAAERTENATIIILALTEGVTVPSQHILQIFLWLTPLVIVVSIAGGIYLSRKSLEDMNRVILAAQSITAERLHGRLPERNVPDEIGRLISTFNAMMARLERSFQQMKQFSGDASHELRTPLAVLRSQLESALNDRISLPEMKRIAANCLDETMHMSTLVDYLLLLAKADAGQEIISHEPVDLGEMIRDIYVDGAALASQRSITVTLKHSERAVIEGDAQRLRQMFLNLIDNAIKYNRDHGQITLDLERENGSAVVTVADSGIGIPEEELSKIFDRFYRVDKIRTKTGGMGLGLSIVKWTVDAHHGSIAVNSTLHKGSAFTIRFPVLSNKELAALSASAG